MSNSISIPIRVCVKDLEITMEMLEKVFEVDRLRKQMQKPSSTTRDRDKLRSQIQRATQFLAIVRGELNRLNPIDEKPMYRHYNLNTEERLAHFFAQCYHEAGSKVKEGEALGENLSYQADVVYEKVENFVDGAKTFDNYKRAFEVGRLYNIKTEKQNGTLRAQSKKETLINQHNDALKKVRKKYGEASEKYKKITEIIKVRAKKTPEIQKFPDIKDLLKNFKSTDASTNNSREFEKLPKANQTDQKGIGNLIYLDANRRKKLGNDKSEDGYDFRGRGMIQLTGKDNYTKFQNFYNQYNSQKKDFLKKENPSYRDRDAIATDPKLAFLSAVWFWYENKLYRKAMPGVEAVKAITEKVNGGYKGLDDRIKAYERIKRDQIFKCFGEQNQTQRK